MLSAKLAMALARSGRKTVKVRSAMWQSGRKARLLVVGYRAARKRRDYLAGR